jgi:hypothetical protein
VLGGAGPWGTILAFDAAGMILGGLLMLRLRPRRPLVDAVNGGLLTALPMLSMATGAPLAAVCAAMLTGGVGIEAFGVNLMTAMSLRVDRDRVSRVSAYQSVAGFGLTPLGIAAAGPVAGHIGVPATLCATSALLLGIGTAVLALPSVWRLRAANSI